MTANNPIPPDAFAAAVESLDTEAFATFVGAVYGASADAVDVDAPRVTVWTDDRRTELLVCPAAAERVDATGVDATGVDAAVVASESLLGDDTDAYANVVTPATLRQRLLYALPSADANAIAERTLNVPARSETYDAATGGMAGNGDAGDGRDPPAGVSAPLAGDASTDVPPDAPDSDTGVDPGSTARPETEPDDSPPGGRLTSSDDGRHRGDEIPATESVPHETAAAENATDAPTGRFSPPRVVAVAAVVALLVAAGGAGFVVGTAGVGEPDGIADFSDDEQAGSTDGSDDEPTAGGDAAAGSMSVADGSSTGETTRNTAPSPTCERSALQVVQIQMNAIRYNDNETNDGVRTLRSFATPENRELVGSVEEYAELFETPQYAPMLTYDTAQYAVPEVGDGTAEVEVITRENGSVTGRYEFRLELIPGGSADIDAPLEDVDDCWMTNAVASSE